MQIIEYTCRDCGAVHTTEMADDAPTFTVGRCPDGAERNTDAVDPVLPVD